MSPMLKREKDWMTTRSLPLKGEHGDDDIAPGKISQMYANRPICCCATWCGVYVFIAMLMALGMSDFGIMMALVFSDEKATTNLQFQGFVVAQGDMYQSSLFTVDNTSYLSSFYTYDAFENGDVFAAALNLEKVAQAEAYPLAVADWPTHCSKVQSSVDGSYACESPVSILNYLRLSPSSHEAGCAAGFCVASDLTECGDGATYAWGTYPCRSRTYDWQDGTLAPAAEWPALILALCATERTTAEYILPTTVLEACVGGTFAGSQYARSIYTVSTWRLKNYDFGSVYSDFVSDVRTAFDDGMSAAGATQPGAPLVATAGTSDRPLNVLPWTYWEDGMTYTMKDLTLLVPISVLVIFLFIWVMVGSFFLACVGMAQIFLAFLGGLAFWIGIFQQKYIDMFQISAIFLILCIGADDIFVWSDTWKESAAQPEMRGDFAKRHAWTFHRAASGMLNTTATTVICLLLNMTSNIPFFWCFGIFNALVIALNYVMCITYFPAATCLHAKYMACDAGPCQCFCSCKAPDPNAEHKEGKLTKGMRETVAPGIYKARWPVLIVSAILMVGSVVVSAMLWKSGETQSFADSNPLAKGGYGGGGITADHYTSDMVYKMTMCYGFKEKASSYPENWLLFAQGEDGFEVDVRYNSDAVTFDAALQTKIVEDCNNIRTNYPEVLNGEAYCILNQLQAAAPDSFPYATEAELLVALEAWYASMPYYQLLSLSNTWAVYTGFVVEDGDIKALWNSYNTTIPADVEYIDTELQVHVDAWDAIMDAECTSGGQDACFVTDLQTIYYVWYLLVVCMSTAISNIVISLGVAFAVVLVTSANWIMAVLATLTIGSVMSSVIASVLMLGYDIDAVACVLLIMVIGMAIDYAVHMAHAYNEGHGSRHEKASEAVQGTGISVLSGAGTTIGAAIPLLFASFLFYLKMGWFIFFVAFWGVIYSFTMLVPLLMIMGPEGTQGDVTKLLRCRAARTAATVLKKAASDVQAAANDAAKKVTQVVPVTG